jgi:mutator protein MutT
VPKGQTPARAIQVAAGLLFRRGRLLITQRPARSHLGGLWEFPGGKRHPGETYRQCLERELREELAIEVEVGERFQTVTHAYPEKKVRLEFFLCRLRSGRPRPVDCAALAWVTKDQLADYEFPPADARLLQRLRETSFLWEQAFEWAPRALASRRA